MILEEHADHCLVQVDDGFRVLLEKMGIFQYRQGMDNQERGMYLHRLAEGDIVCVGKHAAIEQYATVADGYNFFSCGAFTSCASELRHNTLVGRYCSIAENVRHFGFRHPIDAVSTSSAFFNFNRENISAYISDAQERDQQIITPRAVPTPQPDELPVEIGNDVWIGMNVSLAGGIKIGDGAIVAAYSVVTKSVAPYTIVAGIPAVFKRFRFPKHVVDRLISSRWWEYELTDMYKSGLDFSNPVSFLDKFEDQQHSLRKLSVKTLSLYATTKKIELVQLFGLNVVQQQFIMTQHGTILVFCRNTNALRHVTTRELNEQFSSLTPLIVADKFEPKLAVVEHGNIMMCSTTGVEFLGLIEPSVYANYQSILFIRNQQKNHCQFKCQDGYLGAAPNGNVYFDARDANEWETFQII